MTPKRITREQIQRGEAMVSRIQGVATCHISTDADGNIAEVHVVATGGKPPKLIARDVETCLKAGVGISVDYKKIGVVMLEEGETAREEPIAEFPVEEFPSRFVFQSVNVFSTKNGTRAEVELTRQDIEAFGSSASETSRGAPWVLIAEATLKAVSEYLDASNSLCLGGVLKVPVGDETVFVVRVDAESDRGTRALAGCALVSGNENQSVVFATLDAVNRVIGKLDFKSSIEYKIE